MLGVVDEGEVGRAPPSLRGCSCCHAGMNDMRRQLRTLHTRWRSGRSASRFGCSARREAVPPTRDATSSTTSRAATSFPTAPARPAGLDRACGVRDRYGACPGPVAAGRAGDGVPPGARRGRRIVDYRSRSGAGHSHALIAFASCGRGAGAPLLAAITQPTRRGRAERCRQIMRICRRRGPSPDPRRIRQRRRSARRAGTSAPRRTSGCPPGGRVRLQDARHLPSGSGCPWASPRTDRIDRCFLMADGPCGASPPR